MAEGWARHLHGERLEAFSAGLEAHGIDPRAVAVMAERGVEIAHQPSKTLEQLMELLEQRGGGFDWVITVCGDAQERCPIVPGPAQVIHVGFDDPPRLAAGAAGEEEALAHYRRVRDEIEDFLRTLPEFLSNAGDVSPSPSSPPEGVR